MRIYRPERQRNGNGKGSVVAVSVTDEGREKRMKNSLSPLCYCSENDVSVKTLTRCLQNAMEGNSFSGLCNLQWIYGV